MLRHAHLTDIPRIVELAREEHALSPWKAMPFDAYHATKTARGFIEHLGKTLLVSDGGYLAGVCQHYGFSPELVAMEYAWFATDGSGFVLLERFEEWAKRMGAKQVIVHDQMTSGVLSRALRRKGYRQLGIGSVKDMEK
jgi:hypothetical protein